MSLPQFHALGNKVGPSKQLETFPAPSGVDVVTFKTSEFTSLCPITAQPDLYTITISYHPNQKCLESKSLKLYLQTFRNEGIFAEALSAQIRDDLVKALDPLWTEVTVSQTPRGGISLEAVSSYPGQLQLSGPETFVVSLPADQIGKSTWEEESDEA